MATISISITINATPSVVWEEMRHIDRHVNWMADAVAIDFMSEQREGVGTSFTCLTKVGPLATRDVMTITQWEPVSAMGVEHVGLIKGSGVFTLRPHGSATLVTWRESLVFPWWAGGPLGGWCARPILTAIWKKNLRLLARTIER